MNKKKLGVNIDHVATVRNARGENYPSPLKAALMAEKNGANSITVHLREDRRHINDNDLKKIINKIKIPLNLEIAPTREMLNIAIRSKPKFVCVVPEKRKEITTEGGLNIKKNLNFLKKLIYTLKRENIRVSLFIEPKISDIYFSKKLGADCVEFHTGKICTLINKGKKIKNILLKFKKSVNYAHSIGLEVHAGHGLTYISAKLLSKVKNISEFNIGHFLISESIFFGLDKVIKKFKYIINKK